MKMGKKSEKKLLKKLDKEAFEIKQLVKLTGKRIDDRLEEKLTENGILYPKNEKVPKKLVRMAKNHKGKVLVIIFIILNQLMGWKFDLNLLSMLIT